ncbi:hypothetical protein HBB16_21000 [Pseudonocardia sp. MCCB 268]|nr:hypothetical protein [Pseudonocardia cytotoxica]
MTAATRPTSPMTQYQRCSRSRTSSATCSCSAPRSTRGSAREPESDQVTSLALSWPSHHPDNRTRSSRHHLRP